MTHGLCALLMLSVALVCVKGTAVGPQSLAKRGLDTKYPDVDIPKILEAPNQLHLAFSLFAAGTQNYKCDPRQKPKWELIEPVANLYTHEHELTPVAFHYFKSKADDKGGRVTFRSLTDNSFFVGKKVASIPSPQSTASIDWLLLQWTSNNPGNGWAAVKGKSTNRKDDDWLEIVRPNLDGAYLAYPGSPGAPKLTQDITKVNFAKVKAVQRIITRGGNPPADWECGTRFSKGDVFKSPYNAYYVFFNE